MGNLIVNADRRWGRWCLPLVHGKGSGLGNELLPWARAYLMARELGAACLPPAFGRNARRYGRHFGTSALDWVLHRTMVKTLPRVDFTEAHYLAHGGGDVGAAFAAFAKAEGLMGRSPLVVSTSGMWGGFLHVGRASEFVRATLYGSRFARENLAELGARLDPGRLTVAMHVRLGDFSQAPRPLAAYRNEFNVALPLAWFVEIGRQLRQRLGPAVQFQIFSDGTAAQLAPLLEEVQPVSTRCSLPADVSDLLAMSQADLLVCSVSSFSMWGAALSDAPYLWFKPQLHWHVGGSLSIWGHQPGQQQPDSATQHAFQQVASKSQPPGGRAFAVGLNDQLPETLFRALQLRLDMRRWQSDLTRFGVVAE